MEKIGIAQKVKSTISFEYKPKDTGITPNILCRTTSIIKSVIIKARTKTTNNNGLIKRKKENGPAAMKQLLLS